MNLQEMERLNGLSIFYKFKNMDRKRREFLIKAGIGGAGLMIAPSFLRASLNNSEMFFKISIAEWSLNKI